MSCLLSIEDYREGTRVRRSDGSWQRTVAMSAQRAPRLAEALSRSSRGFESRRGHHFRPALSATSLHEIEHAHCDEQDQRGDQDLHGPP